MATLIWVVVAIVVVAVIALVAVGARKRRSAMLRGRFGPEYDRALASHDDQRAAEADLRAREKLRAQFDIKPLPEDTRLRFADEWRDVQELFVDQPVQATVAADTLVTRVMVERGYPMQDFDAQADLVSVDHPGTVENYRFAHAVRQRSETQQASTEDLREADDVSSRQRVTAEPEPPDLATSATGQTNGLAAAETDDAGPVAADPDYYDQRADRQVR
jgi:hypothetical protein